MKRKVVNVGTQTAIKIVKNSVYGVVGDIHIGSIGCNELTKKLDQITGISPWMYVEDIVHTYTSFEEIDRVVKIFEDENINVEVAKMSMDGLTGLATIKISAEEIEEKMEWDKHRGSIVGSNTCIV